jgi:hypothetical protein
MANRSFDEDAAQAMITALPVPRGIAFRYEAVHGLEESEAEVGAVVHARLPDWTVGGVGGMPGWFEATPPAIVTPGQPPRAISLAELWEALRELDRIDGVEDVEPLLLTPIPHPHSATDAEAFAAGFRRDQFGLWGLPYVDKIQRRIAETTAACVDRGELCDWHLDQMKVRQAWELWQQEKAPGLLPGHGVIIGHPDTGYTEHREVFAYLTSAGKSFLRDDHGLEPPDARDDLWMTHDEFLETPGHGTGTASVIVSGEADRGDAAPPEGSGVAPGARILPLRVSRSVLHLDFGNLARAIAYAVDQDVDVISLSLGGPWYSDFVRESIKKAQACGVIVVAAAGNYLPATAFPAALPEVIAVAATNAAKTPWRFSGIGRLVDIAAPGEEVWRARAERENGGERHTVTAASGTSFATACVAGLAALWLSYHGGREELAKTYGLALVPFAFQYLLEATATLGSADFDFRNERKHGAGIANAHALLDADLPSRETVEAFAETVRGQSVNKLTFFAGLFTGGMGLTDGKTAAEPGAVERFALAAAEGAAQEAKLRAFFTRTGDDLLRELVPLIASDRLLLTGLGRWQPGESRLPLLDYLLSRASRGKGADAAGPAVLSGKLRVRLESLREQERKTLPAIHKGILAPGISLTLPDPKTPEGASPPQPPEPVYRELRAYSFDPSLSTLLDTAPIYQVTIPARWERVQPGPVGEYLEVIDIDPASGCVYSPVDLNHPFLLARDGLPPSEGNPQFHQQMVYGVAMNTIHRFELALGRPVFWSQLRPWSRDHDEEQLFTPEAIAMQCPPTAARGNGKQAWYDPNDTRYVQRLRVYPHALREPNAFYSPTKRALLFGYFPSEDDTGREYPGGMVFTCLSHDIIAHETTHALVDGMHPFFNEPSNEDVWAFHEAFADIMALFQHFTYPEVLRHQIASARGDLETDNLLGQLAQQFGQAIGQRGALRNYLGKKNADGVWERTKPDPHAIEETHEPHARGSILVAAVFDAFLALYNDRISDLLRISTGGTGVLPAGQIHSDLANRLAVEAAQTAEEVLRICIRAMDYLPPVDVTFGEFLRALITADYDLAPGIRRRNRVAFIEAFRSWGIYPRDVTTLSEDSLRWTGEAADSLLGRKLKEFKEGGGGGQRIVTDLIGALEGWQPGSGRDEVFRNILRAQRGLHTLLSGMQKHRRESETVIRGLDFRRGARIHVGNVRPARRLGPLGEFRTEMVVEITQTYRQQGQRPMRGGATVIVDLQSWDIRYIIYKSLYRRLPDDPRNPGPDFAGLSNRIQRCLRGPAQQGLWRGEVAGNGFGRLAATYHSAARLRAASDEPFALLHRGF